MDFKRLETEFHSKEIDIIKEYLNGSSIRQISQLYPSYGRTKIRNIIERCLASYPSFKQELENKLFQNRYHKKDQGKTELKDLSEEEIAVIYEEIKSGMTLTEASKKYGRTRDYIKANIIEFINDPEEEKEFLDILKSNMHPQRKDTFSKLSEEEKKIIIFERLNRRRVLNKRKEYSEEYLNKKYEKLRKYFLETRNQKIKDGDLISEEDFLNMLYDRPTLLANSLQNRIIPAVENLDNNPVIGTKNTNRILRKDTTVLVSSIEKTNLQIKILKANGLLESFFEKPRNFRTSPELLYALIEFYKSRNSMGENVFLTTNKLMKDYKITPEELKRMFDVREKYGDDKYFEKGE